MGLCFDSKWNYETQLIVRNYYMTGRLRTKENTLTTCKVGIQCSWVI
jgi:hypothetical protein